MLPGRGKNVGNYAFVDDLVEGHSSRWRREGWGSDTSSEARTLARGLLRIVDEVTGKKHFQVSLPPTIAMFYAGMEKQKAEWLGISAGSRPGGWRRFSRTGHTQARRPSANSATGSLRSGRASAGRSNGCTAREGP